jgi:hypothetical protein
VNFLRNLVRDLVDKKLWPVAAALVLALLAVPVLLGGGSEAPAPRTPEASAAAASGSRSSTTARVSLDTADPAAGKAHRPGAVRNPFTQQYEPKQAEGADTAAGAAAGTGAAAAPSGPSSLGNNPADKTGVTPGGGSTDVKAPAVTLPAAPRVAPSVAQRRVYRVAVRFGETGALGTRHDAARLTALPSTAKPMVMFLGVRSDGKTAVFVVARGVQARGDGWCRPRPTNCQTLEMRAGDSEVLETASGTAGVVQYHLVVARVAKRTLKSHKTAARKHRRVSDAGRELFLAARAREVPGTGEYRYDRLYGVLRAR